MTLDRTDSAARGSFERRRPLHDYESLLDELIQRPRRIAYGPSARDLVGGSRVLVTGAGGSVGGELVRQLSRLEPAGLFLLDHDESALHSVQLSVYGDGQLSNERTVLADIRDFERMENLIEQIRPHIVFHSAAHKHLSILERFPSEAVKTNVLGTLATVLAARVGGVERFVNISTDKAADPTSVLGATKNLGERVVRRFAGASMAGASVRFGNVLGSRGSFLHTLDHQLRSGLPVTVTDPEAERYFMTIPEAAGLVIEAAVLAERGETYLLDMGEPVRIVDLVWRYARLRGLADPRIDYVGLVDGEKLTEQLAGRQEVVEATGDPRIWRVLPVSTSGRLDLGALKAAAHSGREAAVASQLGQLGYALPSWRDEQTRLGALTSPIPDAVAAPV